MARVIVTFNNLEALMATKRIHIFKTGNHTPMKGPAIDFNDQVVGAMANGYDVKVHEAPAVIGHPKTDDPAQGWVKNLSFEDGGLYAELDDLNPAFADAVETGAYKKISASFFTPESSNNPVPGGFYLRHVGFLGAQVPAVKGLDPVQFAGNDEDIVTLEFADISGWTIADIGRGFGHIIDFLKNEFGAEKVNALVPEWTADSLVEQGAFEAGKQAVDETPSSSFSDPTKQPEVTMKQKDPTAEQQAAGLSAREQKLVDDQAAFADQQASFAERESKANAETFIAPLITSGKVLPAEKDKLVNFMAGLSDDDTVSFADGENEAAAGQLSVFKDLLKTLPKRVDFSEATGKDGDAVDFSDPLEISTALTKHVAEAARDGRTITVAQAAGELKLEG